MGLQKAWLVVALLLALGTAAGQGGTLPGVGPSCVSVWRLSCSFQCAAGDATRVVVAGLQPSAEHVCGGEGGAGGCGVGACILGGCCAEWADVGTCTALNRFAVAVCVSHAP